MNRLLLECAAAQILIDFTGALEPAVMSHTFRGWKCTIVIEPDPASIPILKPENIPTATEQAILDLLAATPGRLMHGAILRKLGNDFSDSGIAKALTKLAKAGRISNVPRRGYGTVGCDAK